MQNSVPSERSFSATNFINSKRRNRLNAEDTDSLTFIYVNSKILRRIQVSPSGKWEETAAPENWETADSVQLVELEDGLQPDSSVHEAIQRLDPTHELEDEIHQGDFQNFGTFQGAEGLQLLG